MTIFCMAISCIAGFAIPIILFFYFYKEKDADILPFFVGCGVMLVFVFVLESTVHQIVLGSSFGAAIQNNIWLYGFYGGLMAGLFEETGRLLAFKTVLRKRADKNIDALMYGAGHGGFEAAMILGLSMLSNILIAVQINSGNISAITGTLSGDALAQTEAVVQTLTTTPSYMFLAGILERIFAVILHLALSVLVWFAAKNKNKMYLYPAAIGIHMLADASAVILNGYSVPVLIIEAIVCMVSLLAAWFAKKVWTDSTGHQSQTN